jgi:prepilin-type N-terminal cleavage/methylation domain-containing protein/prepilin-type processing-associated H-X9-DG protein
VKTKKGFTLIELLVVIAIIAILAAIMFPVFARARDKARQTTCLSNTKQITLGVLMYCDDYDEMLTVAGLALDIDLGIPGTGGWYGTGYQTAWGWSDYVADGNYCMKTNYQIQTLPYIKSSKIFHCPNDPNGRMSSSYWAAADYSWSGGPISAMGDINAWANQPLARVVDPGNTILLLCSPLNGKYDVATGWPEANYHYAGINDDAPLASFGAGLYPGNRLDTGNPTNMCNGAGTGPCLDGILCTVGTSPSSVTNVFVQVHNGGTNYGFVDGHSKWYRVEDTGAPHDLWTVDDTD